MTVSEIYRILLRGWLVLLVALVVPVALAFGLSSAATPIYTSTASSFVSLSFASNTAGLAQGSLYIQNQLNSFTQLVKTPVVLDPVIDELHLDTTAAALAGTVSATIPGDSAIMQVRASNPDPQLAADIANAVNEQVAEVAQAFMPLTEEGSQSLTITTVQEATPASVPSSPKTGRNVLLAAFTGLILGVGLVLLRNFLDTRVKTTEEVVELVKAPLLAEIPTNAALSKGKSVLKGGVGDPTLEQYHRLQTNLRFVALDRHPLVLSVSSAIAGEGKTTVVSNLALSFARSGVRTLVIDADLRRQRMSSLFGMDQAVGLTTVLTGQVSFRDALQVVRTAGVPLHVMAAGEIPPNPVEMLGSQPMRHLIDAIKDDYDVIIVDTPALLPVVDGVIVAQWATGALLVARADHVNRKDLESAASSLRQAGAEVLGVVINGVQTSRSYHYYSNKKPAGAGTGSTKQASKRSLPAKPAPKPTAQAEAPRTLARGNASL